MAIIIALLLHCSSLLNYHLSGTFMIQLRFSSGTG